MRGRTGSTRTGIALHASPNVLASLVSGAGVLVAPPLVAVVVTLLATREGTPNAAGRLAARTLERITRASEELAGRIATRGSRPSTWIVAGVALTAGLMLEAAALELDLGNGAILTA